MFVRAILGALSLGSLVLSAQVPGYDRLDVPWLYTTDPVTPLPQGAPWGLRGPLSATKRATLGIRQDPKDNPDDPPNTGVIRKYDFTLTREYVAPDGYTKRSLLVNKQYPGPLIEANWGDTIQVTVRNKLSHPEEGTSLHWHGLRQKDTPWMDGVPSVTQCPIAPNATFTYSFLADQYGTSWWHSHFSGQYADGLFGPMVIHGPQTTPYDIDLGPVILTDYYHLNYTTITERAFNSNFTIVQVPGVNSLINGRNNFNCSLKDPSDNSPCVSNAGLASFKFTAGKKHRLRLLNAGASATTTFSIDGYNLTVIANDFVPLVPYTTQYLKLGVGQRYDVIVQTPANATQPFFLRAQSPEKPCADTIGPNVTAIGYFGKNITTPKANPWPAFTANVQECITYPNQELVPLYTQPSPSTDTTFTLNMTVAQNETGSFLWYMNNSTFRGNYNNPILLLSNLGNNSYPYDPQWNVENFGTNKSVRIIAINDNPRVHPMHLHGHNMFVDAVGFGQWNGTFTRPSNPVRRDTVMVPGFGYVVISFQADNPGAWPFHCHVAWHVAAGLYVTLLERPDEIAKYKIPSISAQTCRDWWAYTNSTVVDQIDSGL